MRPPDVAVVYRSLRIAGKIRQYESSVVEIAIVSTTANVESAPLSKNAIATTQKIVGDDSRHHVDADGRPEAAVEEAEPPPERAVVGRDRARSLPQIEPGVGTARPYTSAAADLRSTVERRFFAVFY